MRNFKKPITFLLLLTVMMWSVMPTGQVLATEEKTVESIQAEAPTQNIQKPEIIKEIVNDNPVDVEPITPIDEDLTPIDLGNSEGIETGEREPNDSLDEDEPEPYIQKDEVKSLAEKLNIEADTSTGAFIYNYPIEVPAGRNGLQPSLALSYNNQNTDNQNLFGYGWGINIPYIERLNKTGIDRLYTENYFNSSLTGELVIIDDVNGIYGSKVENGEFFDYQYSAATNVWIVKDKQGTIYTFGSTIASRQDDPDDGTKVYKWMLEETRDTNDNFIRYEYYKDSGQIYPDKIYFTGHDTIDGIFTVEFLREERADNLNSLATGFSVDTNYRVSEIKISVDNQWEKKYQLNYTTGDNGTRSLMDNIVQGARDPETGNLVTMPADGFNYHTPQTTWGSGDYTYPSNCQGTAGEQVSVADLNGDALPDLICFISTDDTEPDNYAIYINNGDGTWTEHFNLDMPISQGEIHLQKKDMQIADFNGDGFNDFVSEFTMGSEEQRRNGVYIYAGNLNWVKQTSFGENLDVAGHMFIDVNNDGRADKVKCWLSSSFTWQPRVYINTGSQFVRDYNYNMEFAVASGAQSSTPIDINGDGFVDFVYQSGVYINQADGTGWQLDAGYDQLEFVHNYGSGGGWQQIVKVIDINGDDLQDAIRRDYDNVLNGEFLNNAKDPWVEDNGYSLPVSLTSAYDYGNKYLATDINGDGFVDWMNTMSANFYIADLDRKVDAVKSIETSNGSQINIDYKSSAQFTTTDGSLANPNLPFILQTVEQITINDGLEGVSTIGYNYADGEQYFDANHPRDKKFAGFGQVTKTIGNKKTVSYYQQGNETNSDQGESVDNYYKIGKPYRTEVYDNTTQELLSQSINKWEDYDLGHNRKLVYNSQNSQTDLTATNPVSTAKQYVYDLTNGNLLTENDLGKVEVNLSTGVIIDTLVGDEKDVDYEYAVNTADHILAAPKTKTVSNSAENKQQDLYYDDLAHGQVAKVNLTKEDYLVNQVNVEREFNDYGLVTTEIDPEGKDTDVVYDDYNLYPIETTNALAQTTLTSYNLVNGQVDTTTSPNGAVTENTYDAFGRLTETKVSNPDNPGQLVTKQEIEYNDEISFSYSIDEPEDDVETIALWHMDGLIGNAGKRLNSMGSSNLNLVEQNSPTSVADINSTLDGAYDLEYDGRQYLAVADNQALDIIGDLTFEAWVKLESQVGLSSTILAKYNSNTDNRSYSWQYGEYAGVTTLRLQLSDNGTTDSGHWDEMRVTIDPLANDTWHYLAVSWDASAAHAEFYIDGQNVGGTNGILNSIYNGDADFSIGRKQNNDDHLDGSIDEVRISNGIFTGAEIFDHYDAFYNGVVEEPIISPRYVDTKNYFDIASYQTSREYYNGLDQVIQKKAQMAEANQYSTVDIGYDSLGRVVRQSLPYVTDSINYSTPDLGQPAKTYTYDTLDRVLTEATPVGITTYSYDGLTTTIYDANNNRKDFTRDTQGNLVAVKEYNDTEIYTTDYEYNLSNQLTKITDALGNERNFSYDELGNLISQDMVHIAGTPNPATISYTYDKNGNVLTKNNFNGQTINYTYDDLNRPLTESINGQTQISYTYDQGDYNNGQLTQVNYFNNNQQNYNYDILGRLTDYDAIIDSAEYNLGYDYNLANSPKEIIYPNDQEAIYGFNPVGQIDSVSFDDGLTAELLANNISYNVNGQLIGLQRNNGYTTNYTYDPQANYRLTNLITLDNLQNPVQQIGYTYDNVGNITDMTDSSNSDLGKQVTYTYDDLNRLTSASADYTTSTASDYSINYTYNAIGNMTANSDLGNLLYNSSNPHQLTQIGSNRYYYDQAGNMNGKPGNAMYWDHRDRLIKSVGMDKNPTFYEYDYNNQRLVKQVNQRVKPRLIDPLAGQTIESAGNEVINIDDLLGNTAPAGEVIPPIEADQDLISLENPEIAELTDLRLISQTNYLDKYFEKEVIEDNTKSHIYLGNLKLVTVNNDNEPYFIIGDHLNSSSVLVDSAGTVAEMTDYQPYGKINYENTIQSMDDDFGFTGKELDSETDLQYYGARYLDNNTARFISIDPVVIHIDSLAKLLEDPQSLNNYAYSRNNPIVLVDPDGNKFVYFTAAYDLAKYTYEGAVEIRDSVAGATVGAGKVAYGTANAIMNPIETTKATGKLLAEGYSAGKSLASDYISNPQQTMNEIKQGLAIEANNWVNKSAYERGEDIGSAIATAYVMGKATNLEGYKSGGSIGIRGERFGISAEYMPNAKGVGISLRDFSLSDKYGKTRLANFDVHTLHEFNKPMTLPHIDINPMNIKHFPYK